jgi:hypothetical protein
MTLPVRPVLPWAGALAAALALHLVLLLVVLPRHRPVTAPARPALQVTLRLRPPPEQPPAQPPAPPLADNPAAPSAPVQVPAAAPAPPPRRQAPAEAPAPAPPPLPPTPADATAPAEARWLDALQADRAPAPQGNRWRLAPLPWPAAFARVRVRLWISSTGRIERVEIEGAAGRDPAVRALFAPLGDTPMLPALIGQVPVPSVVRAELWPGDDGSAAPDFLLPLPP